MTIVRLVSIAIAAILLAASAWAQPIPEFLSSNSEVPIEGWAGFKDWAFMLDSLLLLTLASGLGLVIGYHPTTERAADTLEEIEAPKVYVLYAVVGAIIGLMVLKYGMVIGFVVFGIGGLIRFRTDLRSATVTGQVILVTLIGLSCGLHLPHVAVLATAFVFVVMYLIHSRPAYRIEVQGLPSERLNEAAAAYREQIVQQGCKVLSEKKNAAKERVIFVVRGARNVTHTRLEDLFVANIDPALRGSVDWEID
jgi:uncharacterized membrane protein YhiD involved in acid resistance